MLTLSQLGCGSALPSLVLFQYAITTLLPLYFTFTDYNISVLKSVTLPNLILTYASTLAATESPFSKESPNPLANLSAAGQAGDLELTPDLLQRFQRALQEANIILTFVSGSWSPEAPFLSLLPTAPEMCTLVLASETIYSDSALHAFSAALVGILRDVRLAKGVVAAKRVYFGVGGSVDAFKIECARLGAVAADVENPGIDLGEEGVRRCLIEVQML
jgi:protein-histidine N-methyltransferase